MSVLSHPISPSIPEGVSKFNVIAKWLFTVIDLFYKVGNLQYNQLSHFVHLSGNLQIL